MLATVDAHAGRWAEGLAHAREASALAKQLGNATQELSLVAWFEAGLGDIDQARADAERALALADDVSSEWSTAPALETLCVLELSRGLARAGVDWLDELAIDRHVGDGSSVVSIPDEIEALLGVGALDRAVGVAADIEAPPGNVFLEANALRTRGLVMEAQNDLDGAAGALQNAVDRYQQLEMPFGAARTLLVLGRVWRRAGHKRDARVTLERADALFESLPAPLWRDRVADELGHIAGRRPTRDRLTDAEHRVAYLAAAGSRNREIAEQLHMSTRTVEGHLSTVYAKLGLRSRTELALFFDAAQEQKEPPGTGGSFDG
jgi:DNA-binding CsgD family transcriptional regulator